MRFRGLLVPILLTGFGRLAFAQQPSINRAPAENIFPGSGSEMFSSYCAPCHGPSGKGNGPAAAALKKQPADLTQLGKKNGGTFPDARVSNFIKGDDVVASHGSRDMPVWGKVFRALRDDKEAAIRIHNLTEYVKSLQQK